MSIDENPEGTVNKLKPLPTQVDYFKPKNSEPKKVEVDSRWYALINNGLVGLGLICLVLLYLMYNGYTTDEVVLTCPEITLPNIPACPPCPINTNTCELDCGDVIMPSSFSVNLTNSSDRKSVV